MCVILRYNNKINRLPVYRTDRFREPVPVIYFLIWKLIGSAHYYNGYLNVLDLLHMSSIDCLVLVFLTFMKN